ncbi:MAG: alpha/beta hydrolase, partial [Actinomycetota bacterium]
LAGAADPITPARWARLVADRLPRARLVVNPASTHDADSGWCASAALRDFVERPDRLLDLSCFDPGGELAPNNLAGAFFDPLDSSVVELTVQGVGAVEARLPDWTAFGYGPTQMRWRGLDLFDPTVVAVQGPDEIVDIVDLVGLEGDFGRWDPAQSELTPTGWSRAVRSSFRVALVRYTDESSGLALVLVAERGDPDELERRLLAPAARSVAVPA